MLWRSLAIILATAAAACAPLPRAAPAAPVREDRVLQAALEDARSKFLAGAHFRRLDVAILLDDGAGWRSAAVGADRPWYPASCVKLAFGIAAAHWCETQGRPVGCLDESVLPMLRDSDNVAAGIVVDAISGTVNGPADGAAYPAWFARRRYTERLLERHGRNSMTAGDSARLMLALIDGRFGDPARDYLRERLRRPLISPNSSLGGGFPEGTVYESKIGGAYDTLAEIVHAELPDGRRLIVAAYSDARDPDGPDDQDLAALAGFARLLLDRLPAP